MDQAPERASRRWLVEALWTAGVMLGAALVYLPLLGRDGLWDPWETHYAEVARRMVEDNDWIVLRWHDENFYSKPVMLFWMVAVSFGLLGVNTLAARLPVALVAVAGVVGVYHYVRLGFGRVQGLVAAACMATMPMYVLIGRQNITDMPFVVAMSVGMLAVMHRLSIDRGGLFSMLLAYALFGVATLTKGLLGFALPGAVLLVMFIVTRRWGLVRRLAIPIGVPVFLAVTLPWYIGMIVQQGGAFAYEFFYLHHLARAGGGVHGERGTFEYFIGHAAYGILPWVVVSVAAVAHSMRRLTEERGEPSRNLFVLVWLCVSVAVFTIARTKFHHYIFPALPPLAVLVGIYLPHVVREGTTRLDRVLVIPGTVLALLATRDLVLDSNRFTRLFTYAYERPIPLIAGMSAGVFTVLVVTCGAAFAMALGRTARTRLAGAASTGVAALGFAMLLVHHMMPVMSLDIGQEESFEIWQDRVAEPGDRFYNWKMNWRGEVYQSRDELTKVSRLDQFRGLASKPGRLYIITTAERFRQLDQEVVRMRGRPLDKLNAHRHRYVMSVWDGPEIMPRPPEPYVSRLPPGTVPVHATMGEEMIEFVGYRVHERAVDLGDSFFVTLYWRALRKVSTRYLVFIHGERPSMGEMMRFTGNHSTGEGFYGPETWKPGLIVEDTFSVCVDYGIPGGLYRLYAGLYKDKDRLEVDDPSLHDGHNRFRMGKVLIR